MYIHGIAAVKRAYKRETRAMMCFVISCATHELRGVVTVITYVMRVRLIWIEGEQ